MLHVTIALRAGPREQARAEQLAERLGAVLLRRRTSLAPLLADGGLVYVVGQEKDELRGGDARLTVNEGLLRSRLRSGPFHPMVAFLKGARRVVDGTLGLAGDALHLSGALGCEVIGVEISPILHALLEEGLPRLARSPRPEVADAASRVRPVLGDSLEVLRSMASDAADGVLLAPMYPSPDKAAPGFELLRAVADHHPLREEHVVEALRVAPRLVVKWPPGLEPPAALLGRAAPSGGGRVEYWLVERDPADRRNPG